MFEWIRPARVAAWMLAAAGCCFCLPATRAGTFPFTTGTAFPWDTPGTRLAESSLVISATERYEPSDLVWHPRLQRLYGVSDGSAQVSSRLFSMTSSGSAFSSTPVSGDLDLEGICLADPASDFLYIGLEQPNAIAEFDLASSTVTRTFSLSPWMTGAPTQGLEALTFVPDAQHPEGGLFYAGLQENGAIYRFSLPILTSATSTSVSFVDSFRPVVRSDLSGLHYDRDRDVLFAIYDTGNVMRAMRSDGALIQEWALPGDAQEGIALAGNVLFIAEDSGAVVRYVPEPSAFVLGAIAVAAVAVGGRLRRTGRLAGHAARLTGGGRPTSPPRDPGPRMLTACLPKTTRPPTGQHEPSTGDSDSGSRARPPAA